MGAPKPHEVQALRCSVTLATVAGPKVVEGLVLGGLAVTPGIDPLFDDEPYWRITHVASGRIVGGSTGFNSEAGALGCMRMLLTLPADWTQPDLAGVIAPMGELGAQAGRLTLRIARLVHDGFEIESPIDGAAAGRA